MALNHPGLEEIQRDALTRRLGAALYRQAAAISPDAVDAVAAVINRIDTLQADDALEQVAAEFAKAMVADRASDYLVKLQRT